MPRLTAARSREDAARGRRLPWWAGWRLVAILITTVAIVGTIGYVVIEGWTLWDAFYMTIITITTVGYGEVHPLTQAGRAFTVLIILSGVGSFFYAFTLFMALLAEGDLVERLDRRRRTRMLDELKDHFILCGFGRMGGIIAREFSRQQVRFVIIERDPERMQAAMEQGFLAVEADASSEEVLRRVRIERARGFVAAVSTDAENVYAVLSARLLRPDLFIIGRAETDDARTKLLRAGADRVISPYQIGGLQLAQTALRPAVVDFVQLATTLGEPRSESGAGPHRRRLDARRPDAGRGRSPAALWRGCRRHQRAAMARWTSTRRPRPPCARETIWSSSDEPAACESSR